ncbi:acetyl-CoA acetyltransferase [Rhodococcus erythropolis]|uniref:acetyl-CoA acetyltransferase n=1 Tax=Rhodococcus qingshengii TaxID=334542 RepID=UPI000935A75A|nr:acetyl-CoA acetyltransferase [Rhodococcus qingshengii]MCZ4547297.1 acetyl-CoA acetyltransferase [Rhodococcus qingshengii]MDJ0489984.1 acetyl-CoA acetyltransferase [Rhodococcus qingshengii]OKA12529.1 acetyl-CoA acetyltransferase [Rhodococcus erythropolis]REK78101.1 acetyl-CoA acetyltransferase [Rhodococcus erythropolis]
MTRKVAIAGVALSDGGKVDDKNAYELMAQASRRALAEAGLTPADVDGLGSTGQGTLPPTDVGEYLGLKPRWIDSTSVGGASWEVMLAHATDAIAAGHADVVLLTYGSTARADIRKGLRGANINWGSRGPLQWDAPYGHTLISKYAMAARRHMYQYGTTIEQLAEVAVSARFNAADNPEAMYRDPITIEDVLSGPMIADPFTKLHCCIRSDGGAAVVLVSEDRVKDLASDPVWVLGSGEATSHMLTSQWDDMTVGPASVTGPLAFARAGLKPSDVDVAEIYDAFSYMLLLTMEDLGFCEKGEGGKFVESGALRLGGELPTNTDGGGLSACHPGQRGLFLIVEAARQLRGESGVRQTPNAKIACVSGTGGWFCSSGTVLLGSEQP